MHLASSGGHIDIVEYLISKKVNLSPKDRWGATPLDDAKTEEIKKALESNGAERGNKVEYY